MVPEIGAMFIKRRSDRENAFFIDKKLRVVGGKFSKTEIEIRLRFACSIISHI